MTDSCITLENSLLVRPGMPLLCYHGTDEADLNILQQKIR